MDVVARARNPMKDGLPYAAGSFVEVRKIDTSATPVSAPGSWKNWIAGSTDNAGSFPVGYAMKGILRSPVRIGEHIDLHRTHRNGICIDGDFKSTPVIAVSGGCLAETFNSIYLITPADIGGKDE